MKETGRNVKRVYMAVLILLLVAAELLFISPAALEGLRASWGLTILSSLSKLSLLDVPLFYFINTKGSLSFNVSLGRSCCRCSGMTAFLLAFLLTGVAFVVASDCIVIEDLLLPNTPYLVGRGDVQLL